MDPVLVIPLIIWLVVFALVAEWAFSKLTVRFFPKFAAQRKVRSQQRTDRAYAKRQQKRAQQHETLLEWAKTHPDDSTAKALLALDSAPVSPSGITSVSAGDDFLAELRRKQQADDDYQQQREARRIAEAMRAEQLLDWAIENPTVPEARRHLTEQLEEMGRQLESTDREISHCNTMMGYMKGDDPESILYTMRRSEAEARKTVEVERVRRIQSALETPLTEDSEQ